MSEQRISDKEVEWRIADTRGLGKTTPLSAEQIALIRACEDLRDARGALKAKGGAFDVVAVAKESMQRFPGYSDDALMRRDVFCSAAAWQASRQSPAPSAPTPPPALPAMTKTLSATPGESPTLEVRCGTCGGRGRQNWETCGRCRGTGYETTEFGEKVRLLVQRNFRSMLRELD